ncbi:MAG: DNA-binding response regulator [Herbinix sp.]|jgi:DNA-binding LytR/AlgR family response regulator|nr:DNA-binding response regulator [Herbinix sp.]
MRIGICDDEQILRRELLGHCIKYKEQHPMEFEVVGFSSGEEVVSYSEQIDILFLDVQMNGMDGLQTAKKIRETNNQMIIIFLTGYTSYLQDGYHVKAFRYLLKPLKYEDFIDTMNAAIEEYQKDTKVFVARNTSSAFIRIKEIMYVEAQDHYTVVRTKAAMYESDNSMAEWEIILNDGSFYRVHKSFIVNMEYVQEIKKTILMDNGEKVLLSLRKSTKFIQLCREYRRRNAR